MIGQPPPFALAAPVFRFRALASHAGRAVLGGDREVSLACLMTARLAAALLPPIQLSAADAAARTGSAKHWLSSLALHPDARAATLQVVDAVAAGDQKLAGAAISRLAGAVSAHLDERSSLELKRLAVDLSQGNEPVVGVTTQTSDGRQ